MDIKEKRKNRNKDLIERLKRGESTQLIPTQMTWYPPRPIIKKDNEIVKQLYGDTAKVIGESKKPKINLVKLEEGDS